CEFPRVDSLGCARGPATWYVPGKAPWPTAAMARRKARSLHRTRPTHALFAPKEQTLFDQIRPGPKGIGPGHICDQSQNAAARRATRRLPLGEPPLVITTHAITSLR